MLRVNNDDYYDMPRGGPTHLTRPDSTCNGCVLNIRFQTRTRSDPNLFRPGPVGFKSVQTRPEPATRLYLRLWSLSLLILSLLVYLNIVFVK